MKKTIILVALAALVACMASCKKDDPETPNIPENAPEKRISKIYYTETTLIQRDDSTQTVTNPRALRAAYTWDGDVLKKIEYYEQGQLGYTEQYTYEDGLLTRVDCPEIEQYNLYFYEVGQLQRIETYDAEGLASKYVFEYADAKVHKAYLTFYMPFKGGTKGQTLEDVITYEWDGDNIVGVRSLEGSTAQQDRYEYDNKPNPYCGMAILNRATEVELFSKNNYLKKTITSGSSQYSSEYTYIYTYNKDGYPTQRKQVHVIAESPYMESTEIFDYEYVEE